jgi:hypothetical protein
MPRACKPCLQSLCRCPGLLIDDSTTTLRTYAAAGVVQHACELALQCQLQRDSLQLQRASHLYSLK